MIMFPLLLWCDCYIFFELNWIILRVLVRLVPIVGCVLLGVSIEVNRKQAIEMLRPVSWHLVTLLPHFGLERSCLLWEQLLLSKRRPRQEVPECTRWLTLWLYKENRRLEGGHWGNCHRMNSCCANPSTRLKLVRTCTWLSYQSDWKMDGVCSIYTWYVHLLALYHLWTRRSSFWDFFIQLPKTSDHLTPPTSSLIFTELYPLNDNMNMYLSSYGSVAPRKALLALQWLRKVILYNDTKHWWLEERSTVAWC